MPSFSQRMGHKEIPRAIQVERMDDALRNSLWNVLSGWLDRHNSHYVVLFAPLLAVRYYKIPADSIPTNSYPKIRGWVREKFFSSPWWEPYDILEVAIANSDTLELTHEFVTELSRVLREELSGYSLMSGEFVPISTPTEVAAVTGAIEAGRAAGIVGVHAHLTSALSFLSSKPSPDYRNSIKESISAVEAAVWQISGEKDSLDDALRTLGKRIPIHRALEEGFKKIYGYTSDEDGIRHAILDQPTVGFEEAKYMLVACSAFVNYLLGQARLAGLLKG